MRGGLRRGLVLLLLLAAAAACTQDFSSFRFVDTKPARDLHDSSTARGAGRGEDDAGASKAVDATHSEPDGHADAQPAADASVRDPRAGDMSPPAAGASAEPQPQAQSRDAGADEDAGPAMLSLGEQCTASWPDLKTGSALCRYCACNSCASPIVDCLDNGDSTQRALCRAVLACAVRTHCKDGECYCAGDDCGYPSDSGDGPCVAEIEAAAGGKRTRVTQLRQLDPPPRDQPYVRAITAITCLYGSDDASPGPTVTAQCMTSCGR